LSQAGQLGDPNVYLAAFDLRHRITSHVRANAQLVTTLASLLAQRANLTTGPKPRFECVLIQRIHSVDDRLHQASSVALA